MTISIRHARPGIEPDLARRSWNRVRHLVASDDPGNASDDLRCFIAVFGHGDSVPESIDRVRRVVAAGTPAHLSRHIAVQTALSSEPDRDKPGTLYMNWLFEPGTPNEFGRGHLHAHPAASLAILAAIQRAPKARGIWPQDDEIAARVITAAVPPKGDVQ